MSVEATLSNTSRQIQEANSFIQEAQCHVEQVISSEETPQVEHHIQVQSLAEEGVQILGHGHSPLNTSHNSYTVAYKLAVLDWYHENGENKTLASKHFGVDRKRIRDWSLAEEQLRSMPQAHRLRKRNPPGKNHARRPPGSSDLDQAVLNWYKRQRESGVVVYSRQLRAKALELSRDCGLPETFKASTQWLHNWKKRYAADIKECSELEEGVVSEEVGNSVTLEPDFEEHLRRLEQVGADLTAGQDDNIAIVASTPEVTTTQLQTDTQDITLTSSRLTRDTTSNPLTMDTNPIIMDTSAVNRLPKIHPCSQAPNGLEAKSTLEEKIKEQDHWLTLVGQTLESLETEVMKKLEQAKLILQQLKTGQECLRQQLQSVNGHSFSSGKRLVASVDSLSDVSRQTKRPRMVT